MNRTRRRLTLAIDVLTLLALIVAVALMVRLQLERRAGADDSAAGPADAASLVGLSLPPLDVTDRAGRRSRLTAAGAGPRLLLLFRSDCPACAAQRPGWIRLAQAARERGIATLALTGEPVSRLASEYLTRHGVETRYLAGSAPLAALRIHVVPTTLLVGPRGRILRAAVGVTRDPESMLEAMGAASMSD